METQSKEQWKYCIEPGAGKSELGFRDLWQYRSLVYLFAKRDFTSRYRQTLLGPLWMFLNPLLTTIVFTIVFGNMANFPTMDGPVSKTMAVPAFLFYMIGNILWNYFANTVKDVSKTLTANVRIMEKVYYPRLVSPVASALSNQMTTVVRLLFFFCFLAGGVLCGRVSVSVTWMVLLLPLLFLQLMLLSLGTGLIISVLTVKYRDAGFMVDFCLQLWLYMTPVVYGLQMVPERWIWLYLLNPVAPIMTTARYFCFGDGYFQAGPVLWSWAATLLLFLAGVLLFNRTEKNFVDVI